MSCLTVRIVLAGWVMLASSISSKAVTTQDADTLMDAYNTAFYSVSGGKGHYHDTQTGGVTYFWGQAEEIEGLIDSYERSGSASYKTKITELLNGFSNDNGTDWSYNMYNDDIMWACIAYLRGYKNTGNTTFRDIAKSNFDMMYARAWDTKLGGGLYWTTDKAEKNACINGPAAIVAYLLYQALNDSSYLTKSQSIIAWEKSKLFNASTGAIYDNISTNGSISTWSSTYNQGTFVGAANYLGDTNSATLAATYTMNSLGDMGWDGYKVMFEYGIAGNNSGFNAIGIRWIARFMKDRGLQSTYLKWLQANANAAWRVRRKSDNLSWCQWFHQSPTGTNFYSWDCISSVVALQVIPPDAVANILTADCTASPSTTTQAPLTVQFSGQGSGAPATSGLDTTVDHLGTITAKGQFAPNEVATNLFDDNIASKWFDTESTSWVQYQYTNGQQQVVSYYRITSGNDSADYPGRNPQNWRLLGSNNGGTNWTTLDTRLSQVFTFSKQTLGYSIVNTQAFNIYRLQIDRVVNPSLNAVQLDEVQLLAPPVYSYFWSFGDGGTSTLQNPQHTYTNNGIYRATLVVSCDDYVGTNTTIITVGPPLMASANGTAADGSTLTIQFNSQASGGNGARAVYDTTSNPGTVTAQGDNPPNEVMACAFDNNSATKWLDFANADPVNRSSWIQYQYANGESYAVSQYAITTANDSPERDPKVWRLLGSNNGGLSWVTLDTRSSGLPTNRLYRTVFSVTNVVAGYKVYQLKIDSVANKVGTTAKQANCVQLAELELIGKSAYSYLWDFGDGTTSTAQNPQHSYATNGNYLATLVVSDNVANVTNTVTVSAIPVLLGGSTTAPGSITLSWPAWNAGCHLYTTTNLPDPTSWTVVTNAYVTNGFGGNVVVPVEDGNRFYQLRSP